MALVSIKQASQLANKSIHTIYRHIKNGKLSKDSSNTIDTAELLRVYGELKQPEISQSKSLQNDNEIVSLLQQQVAKMNADMQALKVESLEREKQAIEREYQAVERERRLMSLLENLQQPNDGQTHQQGLFKKFWKK